MKIILILFLNWLINALVGFYFFANAFNGEFSIFKITITLFIVGIILGFFSGFMLRANAFWYAVAAVAPLLFFFGLFIQGSIENGGVKEFTIAVSIFLMPLIFEGGSWISSAFILNAYQNKKRRTISSSPSEFAK